MVSILAVIASEVWEFLRHRHQLLKSSGHVASSQEPSDKEDTPTVQTSTAMTTSAPAASPSKSIRAESAPEAKKKTSRKRRESQTKEKSSPPSSSHNVTPAPRVMENIAAVLIGKALASMWNRYQRLESSGHVASSQEPSDKEDTPTVQTSTTLTTSAPAASPSKSTRAESAPEAKKKTPRKRRESQTQEKSSPPSTSREGKNDGGIQTDGSNMTVTTVQRGQVIQHMVKNYSTKPTVQVSENSSQTHSEVTGERYAAGEFLRRLKTRLISLLEKKPNIVEKICKEYAEFSDDLIQKKKLQKTKKVDELFLILKERQDLKYNDVVFLQVLFGRVNEAELFKYVLEEVQKWKQDYGVDIRHLSNAPFASKEEIKFHLNVDKERFGKMEQERLRLEIAQLLRVPKTFVMIMTVVPSNSIWVTVEAPALLCEAFYRIVDEPTTQQALAIYKVDKVAFEGITDSQKEETKEIRKMPPGPSTTPTIQNKKLDREEDVERFNQHYDKKGIIYIYPCLKEASKADGGGRVTTGLYTGQVQEDVAKMVVIKKIKAALEEIKCPDDPPVFLLYNQHLCRKRKVPLHVLVLHPSLGVLVLEVKATTSIESSPHFNDAITKLLQAQEDIQKEMGDLLEKNAVVMTIVLPNIQQENTGLVRRRSKEAGLGDHPEIRLVWGSREEVFTEYLKQLKQLRASSHHPFKGSSEEEKLKNYKLACFRRLSVVALPSRQSVRDSIGLQCRFLLTEEQLSVRDSQAQFLHVWGPPGSGKTLMLEERARRWIGEGRLVALAVRHLSHEALLYLLTHSVCEDKIDKARVSTHRTANELLQWLNTISIEGPVYIIWDEALPIDYSKFQGHVTAGRVQGLWSASIQDLPDEDKKVLKALGGTTDYLQFCLRCPNSVMALSNVARGEIEDPPLLPPPVPIMQELGVGLQLICHPNHSQFQSWDECRNCKEGFKTFFSSLGLRGENATSDVSLEDCIVLITSGIGGDMERVARWLRSIGLRAMAEERPRSYDPPPALLPGQTREALFQAELEAWRSRVMTGMDEDGAPTLHVVDWRDFRGLQRPVVILWHQDSWDEDEARQGQRERNWRMLRHSSSWFCTASLCQQRLLLMVATPSPLLSFLQASNPMIPGQE